MSKTNPSLLSVSSKVLTCIIQLVYPSVRICSVIHPRFYLPLSPHVRCKVSYHCKCFCKVLQRHYLSQTTVLFDLFLNSLSGYFSKSSVHSTPPLKMRALRYHGPGDLRLDDIPEPTCKDFQIKVYATHFIALQHQLTRFHQKTSLRRHLRNRSPRIQLRHVHPLGWVPASSDGRNSTLWLRA